MSVDPSPRRAPSREALLAVHTFPGEFVIKAFGPGSGDFSKRATACATTVIGASNVVTSERATRSGRKICVTLTMQISVVEHVEEIYERLHRLNDLLLIL